MKQENESKRYFRRNGKILKMTNFERYSRYSRFHIKNGEDPLENKKWFGAKFKPLSFFAGSIPTST
jgi:hypothetical protein